MNKILLFYSVLLFGKSGYCGRSGMLCWILEVCFLCRYGLHQLERYPVYRGDAAEISVDISQNAFLVQYVRNIRYAYRLACVVVYSWLFLQNSRISKKLGFILIPSLYIIFIYIMQIDRETKRVPVHLERVEAHNLLVS